MATLKEMSDLLRRANPENHPMALQWMSEQWWPEADWLRTRAHNHNGGARVGARVAGGFAGRVERAGLLRMCIEEARGPRRYQWVAESHCHQ